MKDPQISVDHLERIDAILLSFVASYVDTAVFVGLFGLFTSHVTGNFVLIGAALVHHADGVEIKLLARRSSYLQSQRQCWPYAYWSAAGAG